MPKVSIPRVHHSIILWLIDHRQTGILRDDGSDLFDFTVDQSIFDQLRKAFPGYHVLHISEPATVAGQPE